LTSDDRGAPIAARTVLKKTAIKHSDNCPPVVLSCAEAEKFDPRIVRRLRNEIRFEIGDHLFSKEEERRIEAPDLVRRLCSDSM
jgi:hypothetical protein